MDMPPPPQYTEERIHRQTATSTTNDAEQPGAIPIEAEWVKDNVDKAMYFITFLGGANHNPLISTSNISAEIQEALAGYTTMDPGMNRQLTLSTTSLTTQSQHRTERGKGRGENILGGTHAADTSSLLPPTTTTERKRAQTSTMSCLSALSPSQTGISLLYRAQGLSTLANNANTLTKVAKLDDGSFHLPPSRNNGPRDTPVTRKSYHTTASLAGPSRGPNALETTSVLPYEYGSSDEEPLDHLDLTSPSKRPIRGIPRTRAHRSVSPTPNDNMNVDDDVFGHPVAGFNFITPPPASPSPPPQPAAPPPPPAGPPPAPPAAAPPAAAPPRTRCRRRPARLCGQPGDQQSHGLVTPANDVLLNHPVVGREHNGYLGTQPAMATPPVNAEGRTTIQRNDGTNSNLVLTIEQILDGLEPTQRLFIQDNWNDVMIFVMFLGGITFFSRYGPVNLQNDVYDVLSGYRGFDRKMVDIYNTVPDETKPITGAYGGPKILIAHFKHPWNQVQALKTVLANQRTYGCTDTLGFHAVNIEEAVGIRDMAVASYSVSTRGSNPELIERYAVGGARKLLFETQELIQSQATSNGTLQERIENIAWTFDAKYFDHETDPIVTIYMSPITLDPADHERFARLMRPRSFHMGPFSFTPKAYNTEGPECAICTSRDHFARRQTFWGPKRQLSQHTEGVLARGRGRGRGGIARGAFARGGPRGMARGRGLGRGRGAGAPHGGRGRGNGWADKWQASPRMKRSTTLSLRVSRPHTGHVQAPLHLVLGPEEVVQAKHATRTRQIYWSRPGAGQETGESLGAMGIFREGKPPLEWTTVQQRRGSTEPGSAGQIKFWYVECCPAHSHEASPRRPLRGRRGVLHIATNTTNISFNNTTAEIRPGRRTADAMTGGRDDSAPGHLPVEGHSAGGRLAEGRSEVNRDGYQPSGGGSPRRADDGRLDATLDAERRPGGASMGAGEQYVNRAEQQHQPVVGGGAKSDRSRMAKTE
ncbi:hypothetical protein B0H16DRAFT_1473104 [Mycena metata]|uniref:Uncharacterized protein n=1 Tax=Mycena metata TaxID=1033252 RepID=A0AAD7HM26_9AGAR|nr:hypothetical protein B0H16DRAFT_1473104 [Mycena metata]